jgi:hypothetical protein
MLPFTSGSSQLVSIRRDGSPVTFVVKIIKGISYAFFDAVTGSYTATYGAESVLTGSVTLQGRPAPPNTQWQVPLQVDLYTTGNPTPVVSYNTTTDQSGQFVIEGVPQGTYNITVKNPHTLKKAFLGKVIVAGNNTLVCGTLREGDANNDNAIDLLDFSILLSTYNKAIGEIGYDPRADFNSDDAVDLLDFSLLLPNYNQEGEENP